MKILQPPGWVPPKGYANGVAARGTLVFVGGQIGWNAQARFESEDFIAQTAQALRNVRAVLQAAGAGPEHMVRMTWYVTSTATNTWRAFPNSAPPTARSWAATSRP